MKTTLTKYTPIGTIFRYRRNVFQVKPNRLYNAVWLNDPPAATDDRSCYISYGSEIEIISQPDTFPRWRVYAEEKPQEPNKYLVQLYTGILGIWPWADHPLDTANWDDGVIAWMPCPPPYVPPKPKIVKKWLWERTRETKNKIITIRTKNHRATAPHECWTKVPGSEIEEAV